MSHGMVALDADGKLVAKLPGHNFTKEDIETKLLAKLQS